MAKAETAQVKTGELVARGWCPVKAPLVANYCYFSGNVRYDLTTSEGVAAYEAAFESLQYSLKATTRALDLTPNVSADYEALRSNTTRLEVWVDGQDNTTAIPIDVLSTPPTVI